MLKNIDVSIIPKMSVIIEETLIHSAYSHSGFVPWFVKKLQRHLGSFLNRIELSRLAYKPSGKLYP